METLGLLQSMWGAVGAVILLFACIAFSTIFGVRKSISILMLTLSLFGLYNLYYVIDSHLGKATFKELPSEFFVVSFFRGEDNGYFWILEDLHDTDTVTAYGISKEELKELMKQFADQGYSSVEGKMITLHRDKALAKFKAEVREFDPERDLEISKDGEQHY